MGYIGAGVTRFNTADGLTVSGDAQIDTNTLVVDSTNNRVGIGTTSPDRQLHLETATGGILRFTRNDTTVGDDANIGLIEFETQDSGSSGVGAYISAVGDGTGGQVRLEFATGTGGSATENMVITSGGNVGIGTASPSKTLTVHGSDGTPLLLQGSGNDTAIAFAHSGTNNAAINASSDGAIEFRSGGSGSADEAMRIDSSGNLLVGKTSSNFGTAGAEMLSSGALNATRSGNAVAWFNRLTSNGTIAVFQKDGTTVGKIGVDSGDNFTIGASATNHAGLYFNDLNGGGILPMRGGSLTNGTVQLGSDLWRFDDLYLSGGVYLGGTGSANKLDDYEEGTWTPAGSTNSGSNPSFSNASGRYVKIGKLVHVSGSITNIDKTGTTSTSQLRVVGLPYTIDDIDAIGSVTWSAVAPPYEQVNVEANTNEFLIFYSSNPISSNTRSPVDFQHLFDDVSDMQFSITYYTDQ